MQFAPTIYNGVLTLAREFILIYRQRHRRGFLVGSPIKKTLRSSTAEGFMFHQPLIEFLAD
jgi:hypothetical protein